MRHQQRLSLVLLWFALGCRSKEIFVFPGLLDGDLIIIAAVGPSDEILGTAAGLAGDGVELSHESEESERILSFVIPAGSVLTPEGTPFSAEELRALKPHPAVSSPLRDLGACGRCLVPPLRAPMILGPGDDCPPPPFARIFEEDREVDRGKASEVVRLNIRLSAPGGCACVLEPVLPAEPLEFRVIEPKSSVYPIERTAQLDDGTLGLFSEKLLVRREPNGMVKERELAVETYGRYPLGAAGLSSGDFVVALNQPEIGTGTGWRTFVRVDRLLEQHPITVSELNRVRPNRLLSFRDASDRDWVVILGWIRTLTPDGAIEACVLSASDVLDCPSFIPSGAVDSNALDFGAVLPGGRILVGGSLAGEIGAGDPRDRDSFAWGSLRESTDPFLSRARVTDVAVVQDRAVICVNGPGGSMVLLAEVDVLNAATASSDLLSIFRIRRPFSSYCLSLGFSPRDPRLILLADTSRQSYELDREGEIVSGPSSLEDTLGVPVPVVGLAAGAREQAVARTASGAFYVHTATGAPFAYAYGPSAPWRGNPIVIPKEETFMVLGNGPRLDTVRVLAGTPSVESSTVSLLVGVGESARAAAIDSRDGTVVVAGCTDSEARGWIRRFLPADGGVDPLQADAELSCAFVDLEELSPGRFLLIEANRAPLVIYDQGYLRLPIEWDSPVTEEIELEPSSTCFDSKSGHEGSTAFVDASAAQGVGWLVGCEETLVRVEPDGSGGFRGIRMIGPKTVGGGYTSVSALCPDRLLLAANFGLSDQGRLDDLFDFSFSADGGMDPASGILEIHRLRADLRHLSVGSNVWTLGNEQRLTVVFNSGAKTSGSDRLFRIPLAITGAAADRTASRVLLAGRGGWLALGLTGW